MVWKEVQQQEEFTRRIACTRFFAVSWSRLDIRWHWRGNAISKEVHRVFFHKFIRFGSTELFSKLVVTPISMADALTHMAEFSSAGLPGCIGSINCTHIVTERCEYNLKNNHLGFKYANTICTYNLTCNHRRRILARPWWDLTSLLAAFATAWCLLTINLSLTQPIRNQVTLCVLLTLVCTSFIMGITFALTQMTCSTTKWVGDWGTRCV